MPEGEPTQNNMIENVLTGPKGYWGARARVAGLPPTAANRAASKTRRRSRRREPVYMRPVPNSNKAVRFQNPKGFYNNVEKQLHKKILKHANTHKKRFNGYTLRNYTIMPREERIDRETKMSHNTFIEYGSNSFPNRSLNHPMKMIVHQPWPQFRKYMSRLHRHEQLLVFKFMERIYQNIRRKKSKEIYGGLTLEEIGKKSGDNFETFIHGLSNDNASKALESIVGDFNGKTLSEIAYMLTTGHEGSTIETREKEFMKFLESLPLERVNEVNFLVNLYLLYPIITGKDLPGYSNRRWTAPS